MKRTSVSLLVIAVLLVSLFSGCAAGGQEPAPAGTSAPAATGSETPAAPAEEAPVAKEERPELTLFVSHSWFSDNLNGVIPEMIMDIVGVNVIMNRAVDESQLPVMIASGDLTDLVYTDSELSRLSNPNLCLPYNKLIEEYGLTFNVSEEHIQNAKSFSSDDNYYTLLNAFSTKERWDEYPAAFIGWGTSGIAVRQDLMDELDIPEIKSMDDLYDAMMIVKNAKPDIIPMVTEVRYLKSSANAVANFLGCVSSSSGFVKNNGKIVHYINTPEYYDYLQYMNKLYRSGLIFAENFTHTDTTEADELVRNGKVFALSFNYQCGDYYTQADPVNLNYKQIVIPLSEKTKYLNASIGWSGTFISKNTKHPEAAIRLMQFLFSDEGQRLSYWGREGIDYELAPEGYPLWKGGMAKAYYEGDFSARDEYNISMNLAFDAVTEGLLYDPIHRPQSVLASDMVKRLTEYDNKLTLITPKADTEEDLLKIKLRDLYEVDEVKVILSNDEAAFEANYAELMANAEKIGLAQYEAYGEAAYAAISAAG